MSGTFTLTGKLLHHDHVTPHVSAAISVEAVTFPDGADNVVYSQGADVVTDADGSFSTPLLVETALYYTVRSVDTPPLFADTTFLAPAAGATVDLADIVTTYPGAVTPSVLADTIAARDAALAAAAAAATFDPAGYVAVPSSAIDVTRAAYGASGAGTGDQTAAIQAAIDAATAFTVNGVTDVLVPTGTFQVSGKLQGKNHVRIRGAGIGSTTIKSTAGAATNPIIELIGASDCEVLDLTVDCNNRTNSIGISSNATGGTGTRHAVRRTQVKNSTNNAIRFAGLARGWTVQDCVIDTCTNGVWMAPPASGISKDLRIVNTTFTNVGTNVLAIGNTATLHTMAGVMVLGNILRDFQNVGPNGPIPIEVTWCDDVIIANNFIGAGGTRGISTGQNYNMAITGNVVRGQSIYAIEDNGNQKFTITGNTLVDCAMWIAESAQSSDGLIHGNTCVGTGLAALAASSDGIKYGNGAKRIRITGNVFSDWQYLRAAVRVGETTTDEDVVVEGNTFIINDANTPVVAIAMRKAIRSVASRNTIRITRNLVAGDDINDVIMVTLDAASADISVEGNDILYTGTTAAAANSSGIGHGSTGAATLPGLVVRRNRVKNGARGLRLSSVTSADAIVDSNDTRTCTAVDALHANTVIKTTIRQVDGTAAPTAGTWVRGDICWNTGITAGAPAGWICTAGGTPGTWALISNAFPSAGADNNLKASNVAPESVGTAFTPTAGVGYVSRVVAAQSGASVTFKAYVNTAGATVANAFVAVYDSTGVRIGVSADISTSLQSTGEKALTISSAAIGAGAVYYLMLVIGSAGTMPVMRGPAAGGLFGVNGVNRLNTYLTGLTATPSPLVLGSLASAAPPFPWMALA